MRRAVADIDEIVGSKFSIITEGLAHRSLLVNDL